MHLRIKAVPLKCSLMELQLWQPLFSKDGYTSTCFIPHTLSPTIHILLLIYWLYIPLLFYLEWPCNLPESIMQRWCHVTSKAASKRPLVLSGTRECGSPEPPSKKPRCLEGTMLVRSQEKPAPRDAWGSPAVQAPNAWVFPDQALAHEWSTSVMVPSTATTWLHTHAKPKRQKYLRELLPINGSSKLWERLGFKLFSFGVICYSVVTGIALFINQCEKAGYDLYNNRSHARMQTVFPSGLPMEVLYIFVFC